MTEQDADNHVASLMPDRPIGSAYEVAVLYSLCNNYEKQRLFEKLHGDSEFQLSTTELQYLTPNDEAEEFDGEPGEHEGGYLVAARADLSGDEPQLDPDNPVVVEALEPEMKFKLGYIANQGKSGAATDYSLTNHLGSSGQDVETIAYDSWGNRFLRGRFESWPADETATQVAEEEELDVVQSLKQLGEDETEMERLQNALLDMYSADDELEGFVSVLIKTESDGEYRFPGEIPQINQIGIEKNNQMLREGRSISSESHGTSVGFVEGGEEQSVVGASKGLFAEYGKKQRDAFPDLDASRGWEQRPISEEVAKLISGFNSLEGRFGYTNNGMLFVYLPYPREPVTQEVFEHFYENVYSELVETDSPEEYLRKLWSIVERESSDFEWLEEKSGEGLSGIGFEEEDNRNRKYSLDVYALIAQKEQTSLYRVYLEEPRLNLPSIIEFNNSYKSIIGDLKKSQLFDDVLTNASGHPLLSTGSDALPLYLYGGIFDLAILDALDSKQTTSEASADDSRIDFLGAVLEGNQLDSESLIRRYLNRTIRETRDEASDGQGWFADLYPVVQMCQLHALDSLGLLREKNISSFECILNDEMSTDTEEERLETFLSSHQALASGPARATFLVGSLIGKLSAYQSVEDVSSVMAQRYPVSAVNRRTIHEVAANALEKNEEYSDVEGYKMNEEVVSRLPAEMLDKDPSDWELSNSKLQWLYSLGIAFGKDEFFSSNSSN